MTNTNKLLFFVFLILCFGVQFAAAQQPPPAPPYKISAIKIVPFDGQTGAFAEEFTAGSERSFFNDLAISLFVTIEISGKAGTFEAGRKVEVTVTEGKKSKTKKLEQVGLIGDGGKFYFPVFLEAPMCDEVKITARLVGQKTASSLTRTVPFMCGE